LACQRQIGKKGEENMIKDNEKCSKITNIDKNDVKTDKKA